MNSGRRTAIFCGSSSNTIQSQIHSTSTAHADLPTLAALRGRIKAANEDSNAAFRITNAVAFA